MLRGLESVGVILIVFAVGYFFQYKKLWPESSPSALSSAVIRISAPCLAVTSIVASYDRETLASSIMLLLIALLHLLVLYLLSKCGSRLLGLAGGRKAIFENGFTFSNIIFIGLPINQIVFGESGMAPLFAYYIVSFTCFWSLGFFKVSTAADPVTYGHGKRSVALKRILNPSIISVIIGYLLVQANLGLPLVLDTALGYLANLTVPLSMLVIGANLTMFGKGIPRITKDEIFVLIAKFLISPLVMFILLKIFGVTGLPFYVFLLSSTMPCHMQSSIIAQQYDVEPAFASKLVGLSTLFSIITIPCYVALIHTLMLSAL